jgi:hypothetical protein
MWLFKNYFKFCVLYGPQEIIISVDFEPPEPIGFRYVEFQNVLNLVKAIPYTTTSNIVSPKELRPNARGGPFKTRVSTVFMGIDRTGHSRTIRGLHEDRQQ